MKKILTATLLSASMLSSAAFAHVEFDNQCDVNVRGQVEYQNKILTITTDDGDKIRITPDYELFVNGKDIALDSKQQRWLEDYYNEIDRAIPMTFDIATEGLSIASTTINEVFGELLGQDDALLADFDEFFADMSYDLKSRYYAADGTQHFTIDDTGVDGWMDSQWEAEFEEKMESLISNSIGRILIAVGTQMLWEDGDMEAFGERMDSFGESIEQRVEARSVALEEKADALCLVLADADIAEQKLQQSVDALAGLNILNVEDRRM